MKLLVIGIDGGDRRIIEAMDMPCLQQLLSELSPLDIHEDLWSRGWSEITTGMHGTQTGAFYDKPVLDGGTGFTQKYSVNDYEKVPGCKPIWSALAEKGQKMGFLNLPTSIPAPDVPGFFISGPGAGFSPASRIPTQACSPKALYNKLIEENIIWEQRYHVSGIQSIDLFIERCCNAVQSRARLLECLSVSEAVDIDLIFHKEFTIMTNLFMYEVEQMVNASGLPSTPLQKRIAEFFRVFDDTVQYLVNRLDPEDIMVVSDHSARPYKHSLNLNQFLKNLNFQKTQNKSIKTSLKAYAFDGKRKAKAALASHPILRLLQDTDPFHGGWLHDDAIDFSKTVAFTSRYVPGIYINDQRFRGPVSNPDRNVLIREIIDAFNCSSEAKSFSMKARSYREEYKSEYAYNSLPDIWIDLPDGIFPEAKGCFIQKNPYWARFESFRHVPKDVIGGMKGRDALCYAVKERVNQLNQKYYNLSDAYNLILSHFT